MRKQIYITERYQSKNHLRSHASTAPEFCHLCLLGSSLFLLQSQCVHVTVLAVLEFDLLCIHKNLTCLFTCGALEALHTFASACHPLSHFFFERSHHSPKLSCQDSLGSFWIDAVHQDPV